MILRCTLLGSVLQNPPGLSGVLTDVRCLSCSNVTLQYDYVLNRYDTYGCDFVEGGVESCSSGEVHTAQRHSGQAAHVHGTSCTWNVIAKISNGYPIVTNARLVLCVFTIWPVLQN